MKVKAIQMPVKSDQQLFIVKYIETPKALRLQNKYYHYSGVPVNVPSFATLLEKTGVTRVFPDCDIEWEFLN